MRFSQYLIEQQNSNIQYAIVDINSNAYHQKDLGGRNYDEFSLHLFKIHGNLLYGDAARLYEKQGTEIMRSKVLEEGIQYFMNIGDKMVIFRSISKRSSTIVGFSSKYISDLIDNNIITVVTTKLSDILTNYNFLNNVSSDYYTKFVKDHFKNNQILMNKWLKYGETIRNEN